MATNENGSGSNDGNSVAMRVRSNLSRLHPLVRVAIALVFIQFMAVAIYTLIGVVQLVTGRIEHLSVGIALTVFSAVLSWFLYALLKGSIDGRPWVRGPLVTLQIFIMLVGVSVVQGDMWIAGVLLILFGAGTIAVFLSPKVYAHIGVRELSQD